MASFQISSATVQELDEYGVFVNQVTAGIQRAGVRDWNKAAAIAVGHARRILVAFITREDATSIGRDLGKLRLVAVSNVNAANGIVETPLSRLSHE